MSICSGSTAKEGTNAHSASAEISARPRHT
ncbi:uncharacterized protein CPUR_03504 [Claviceps purpurea 20.1]|uniref:Uncharacterized protein n=1 Tax=Claviceps purpurea (strain 20.1) TaxID=1111077 RepID=M1VVK0_CLAP2|nr:uncharacterized protein CPUR_03504 [Claviceps purpurea 20.1]